MRKSMKRLDNQQYFTWDFLMKQRDKNGEVPEIFIACSRVRGPGKTTDMGRQMLAQWMGDQCPLGELIGYYRKIAILTTTKQMLGTIAEGTLSSAISLFYPDCQITEKVQAKSYSEIWLRRRVQPDEDKEGEFTEECMGYVLPLNSRKTIKEISGMFLEVGVMFLDEFIAPDNDYVPDFANKFIDIHNSVARGEDPSPQADPEKGRYVPVFLAANCITQDNPLFIEMDLTQNLQNDTRLYRGNGLVYQRCENTFAVSKQSGSRFNSAFGKSKYLDSRGWMIDDFACIEKPVRNWGRSIYEGTIIVEGKEYGAYWYPANGIIYVCHNVDSTCPHIYNATLDGKPNIPYLKTAQYWKTLRDSLHAGLVRFQDSSCAKAVLYTCR